jgi:hypothetical protein
MSEESTSFPGPVKERQEKVPLSQLFVARECNLVHLENKVRVSVSYLFPSEE